MNNTHQNEECKQSISTSAKTQKLIGYHGNVPRATAKLMLNYYIYTAINAESSVKISPSVAEIFGDIVSYLFSLNTIHTVQIQ